MAIPSSDSADTCGKCSTKISLIAQARPCNCGFCFCDKHRAPEKHDCQFDYQADQARRIRQSNPQVHKPASDIQSEDMWIKEYRKHHEPRCRYTLFHCFGFLVFLYFAAVRGVILNFLFGSVGGSSWFGGGTDAATGSSSNGVGAAGTIGASKSVDLADPNTYADLLELAEGTKKTEGENVEVQSDADMIQLPDELKSEKVSLLEQENRRLQLELENMKLKQQLAQTQTGNGGGGPSSAEQPSAFLIMAQQILYGLVLGYIVAHIVPHLLDKMDSVKPKRPMLGGCCRFCLFSWDVASNPKYALLAEWDNLKDQLLYWVITAKGTNCLSYLYTQQDRSTGTIYKAVSSKLVELQGQRGG